VASAIGPRRVPRPERAPGRAIDQARCPLLAIDPAVVIVPGQATGRVRFHPQVTGPAIDRVTGIDPVTEIDRVTAIDLGTGIAPARATAQALAIGPANSRRTVPAASDIVTTSATGIGPACRPICRPIEAGSAADGGGGIRIRGGAIGVVTRAATGGDGPHGPP